MHAHAGGFFQHEQKILISRFIKFLNLQKKKERKKKKSKQNEIKQSKKKQSEIKQSKKKQNTVLLVEIKQNRRQKNITKTKENNKQRVLFLINTNVIKLIDLMSYLI